MFINVCMCVGFCYTLYSNAHTHTQHIEKNKVQYMNFIYKKKMVKVIC